MKENLINQFNKLYDCLKEDTSFLKTDKKEIEELAAIQTLKSKTDFFENENFKNISPLSFIQNNVLNNINLDLLNYKDDWIQFTLNVNDEKLRNMMPYLILSDFDKNIFLMNEIVNQNIKDLDKEKFTENLVEKVC